MKNIREQITAKSCPIDGEINDRIAKGFKTLEIQLYPEHVCSADAVERSLEAVLRDDLSIPMVHAPLDKSARYQLIECFSLDNAYYLNTLKFADGIARHYEKPVSVVFHTQLSMPMLNVMQNFYTDLVNQLKRAIEAFPMVTYSIENVTPTDDCRSDFCPGCYLENVELCKMLREDIDCRYFFTTLDTCHALTTLRISRELEMFGYRHDVKTLGQFFSANMPYCNNVHLAGVEGLGYYKGTHGIRMLKSSVDLDLCLRHIREYIKDDARVTLEIIEDDYFDVKNAPAFRDDIITIFN